ncbi:MAG: Tex family protein [Anaerolineales bacterium]
MNQNAILTAVAADLSLARSRVGAAVSLLDEGNTVPFIARYRKERTDSLDEEQLRQIEDRLAYRRNLEERRESVLRSLEEQDVLTPELQAEVEAADTLQRVEDLYRPYRPKRRTRATMAREKGLGPLGELIVAQTLEEDREALAAPFLGDEVPSVDEAYAGARDVVAEMVADDPDVRASLRGLMQRKGALIAALGDEEQDPEGTYEVYYDFFGDVRALRPHQILALNRAEREGVLKVSLEVPESQALGILGKRFPTDYASSLADDLVQAREDGYQRLLFPAVDRETRRALTEEADAHAIDVFARNLKALLLQPPLRGQTVLGIDPGIRTGCKVAVVDPTGKVLATTTIYPDRHQERAKETLKRLAAQHGVTVIAIGNGTASRETEVLVAEALGEGLDAKYTIVNEAGASVYSASRLARQELPDLDVSLRGAVSIARRLQDPLAELVKIDPQAIGVGLYQHDVDQKALGEALDVVVESAVNSVGVDLNTASPALLQYVSGIGPKLAETIVAHRDEQGPFPSRAALRKVSGVGPKTFEQAAGFLRVPGSDLPLDNTPIHPESYAVARALLERLGLPLGDPALPERIAALRARQDLSQLAGELGTGVPTLKDILEALARPGRDPRDALEGPLLRGDVKSMDDLREGMRLKGTVRNVVDFGAFVDIGVKRDGLIHISKMGQGYVHNPHDKVAVGDVVEVEIVSVDRDRGRIGLALVE